MTDDPKHRLRVAVLQLLRKDGDGERLDPYEVCGIVQDAINEVCEGPDGEPYTVELTLADAD
jgi:hypothetical protein